MHECSVLNVENHSLYCNRISKLCCHAYSRTLFSGYADRYRIFVVKIFRKIFDLWKLDAMNLTTPDVQQLVPVLSICTGQPSIVECAMCCLIYF